MAQSSGEFESNDHRDGRRHSLPVLPTERKSSASGDGIRPRKLTSKETRKHIQKNIEKRVAKARLSKLTKKLSVAPGVGGETAHDVKTKAKRKAGKLDAGCLSEFITLLHRKNLTLQGERDVFKWLTDFCTAHKNAEREEEDPSDRATSVSFKSSVYRSVRAQTSEDEYRQKILEMCENEDWMKTPGPVGDIPVHLAFLFKQHELGMEMIQTAVDAKGDSDESAKLKYRHELVNTPYTSDLEWWFEDKKGPLFKKLQQLTRAPTDKEAQSEALCTVGCDKHCTRCDGSGGKDGGLFTGETLLHIAIVQHQEATVQWLLDNGAFLHVRAQGLFFQPRLIEKYDVEKTRWEFRDQCQNQLGGSCYYGEYPLSFAAAVGDEHICHMLVDKAELLLEMICNPMNEVDAQANATARDQAKKLRESLDEWLDDNVFEWSKRKAAMGSNHEEVVESLQSAFVNMRDARGNTALHMAVTYEQTATVDWLLDNGAEPSLRMLNNQHLTPLTLAVRQNSVEVFQHLAAKLQIKAWAYGSVAMTITNLEQIDTFRMAIKRTDKQENALPALDGPPEPLQFRVRGRRQEESLTKRQSGSKMNQWRKRSKVSPAEECARACSLHEDPYWRSALEVVVQHEIHAFHATPIFQQLVEEKWLKFARYNYILSNILPYAVFVAFTSASIWQRANDTIVALDGSGTWNGTWQDETWETSRWAVAGLELSVYAVGIPFLLLQAWQSRRLKRLDWDPNEDLEMSSEEVIFFLHKNASFGLNTLISGLLISIGILRIQGPRGWNGWYDVDAGGPWKNEMDLHSVTMMLIWCNFLHQLLPFKFVGPLLITVWRMLIGDVTRWLIVFIFILVGFSQSIAILSNALNLGLVQDRLNQGPLNSIPDDPTEGLSFASWSFMIDYIYVSMGEVGQDFIENHRFSGGSGSLILFLHILFIILSTLLLLNLLIALMGNTLANETSNEGFAKWWMLQAEIVLRFERRLSPRSRSRYRSGDPSKQIDEDDKKYSEFFRVLVGADNDLDNDWGDAKPLSNEELKAVMDVQQETLMEKWQESRQNAQRLEQKVDKAIERIALMHQQLVTCISQGGRYSPSSQSRSPLPPSPQRTTFAPLDDGERRAPGGSFKRRQSVPTASKPAKVTIAISEEDGVSAENGGPRESESLASPRPEPETAHVHAADSAPSVTLPARTLRPLRPLPVTHPETPHQSLRS